MDMLSTIREYVKSELIGDAGINLVGETPLIEKGLLTSLQVVDLVLFLEERFSTYIDPEDLTEENFKDLSSIVALVESKEGAS